jgi:nucleoside-diphosphate-sugar epimerase
MRVVIAGGHGQIALHLERLLAARGDEPVGLIRNPDHSADLQAAGATPVVVDLEQATVDQLAASLARADAVVFAAGAGPGSGADRKDSVDRAAAALLADAAQAAGVRRYVMVSAMGADGYDPNSTEVFQVYLRAKAQADADLRGRDLDWTVVRPGGLTNSAPTGLVTLGDSTGRGSIPRADVAAVLLAVLDHPTTVGQQFELISGPTPIAEALTQCAG